MPVLRLSAPHSRADDGPRAAAIPGRWDHLLTYAIGPLEIHVDYGGESPELVVMSEAYVLAWEDMPWTGRSLGDDDFDDMIYVVGRVLTAADAGAAVTDGAVGG